jgi:hypothetical protein
MRELIIDADATPSREGGGREGEGEGGGNTEGVNEP